MSAEARFDNAAEKLGLDDGVRKVLRTPTREVTVNIPVQLDDGRLEVFTGYRVQHSHGARPGQRRHSLRARCDARRSARAGVLDDVEMRGGQYPVRRREGRRDLRSVDDVRRRTGAHHAALYGADYRCDRAGSRRSRARREHQRSRDGVDHGHLLDAQASCDDGRGDGQADGTGRVARAQGSHRTRLHDGDAARRSSSSG